MIANFANDGIVRDVTSADAAQLTVSDTILRGNDVRRCCSVSSGRGRSTRRSTTPAPRSNVTGFAIEDGTRATITDSIATRNTEAGFVVHRRGQRRRGCSWSATRPAATAPASQAPRRLAQAVVSNSTIVDNTTGLASATGGQLISRVNNTLTGNTTDGAFTGTLAAAFRTAPRTNPSH